MSEKLRDGEAYYLRTDTGFTIPALARREGKHYGQHPTKGESVLSDQEAEGVYEYIESQVEAGCKLLKESTQ